MSNKLTRLGKDLLANTGLASTLPGSPIPVTVPLPKPPTEVPEAFFEEVASLPVRTTCRGIVAGEEKVCMGAVCDPGTENNHGASMFLLPGEEKYLRKRMATAGIPWKWKRRPPMVVGMQETCPYHDDTKHTCGLSDFMPFVCRSFPVRGQKEAEDSMRIMSAITCAFHLGTRAKEDPHYNAWITAWNSLIPLVPDPWWQHFRRFIPQGFVSMFNLIGSKDLAAGRIPVDSLIRYAQTQKACKKCVLCEGAAFVVRKDDRGVVKEICSCVTPEMKQEVLSSLSSPRQTHRGDWERLQAKTEKKANRRKRKSKR